MRVITGSARGKRLKTLEGINTRPTTDRIKESVFNIIQFDLEGRRILDLFGGSGQLAIEAISRGAASAVISDNSREAIQIIRENIENCGLKSQISVHFGDYKEVIERELGKFDLIFLDPPYQGSLVNDALIKIAKFDILSNSGIIVCETERDKVLCDLPESYRKGKEYLYGKTKITVFRKVAD